MLVRDLNTMAYRSAWAEQESTHAAVLAGGREQLLLVEHPPVVTLGRMPGLEARVLASSAALAERGVDVVETDRGGQVTFHGPGQLVVYPIVRLADHRLSVGAYVHGLEDAVIAALGDLRVPAGRHPAKTVGVFAHGPDAVPRKIAAVGVRVRRGVTLHGLALNVTTDLSCFDLIVPCEGDPVTSIARERGDATPPMAAVKAAVVRHLARLFTAAERPSVQSL
ncbi:MAG TPA: lipoyl(octanoyl) transferase LipB [Tepidisphaeraceae bacterium]|nr:lipoyl(octanoyl) transferase LipB [Tepidisphaeraceae bacterium]